MTVIITTRLTRIRKAKIIASTPRGGWILNHNSKILIIECGKPLWKSKKDYELDLHGGYEKVKIGQTVYFDEFDILFSCSKSFWLKISNMIIGKE